MNKMPEYIPTVYLSRRNLLTLLSKLDRQAKGEATACTLIKGKNHASKAYQQTMERIAVVAVEDHEIYGSQNRQPDPVMETLLDEYKRVRNE